MPAVGSRLLNFFSGGHLLPLAQEGNPLASMLPALVGMAVLFYFMIIRPQSKERRRHEELLRELKKNDHVITIGGIYGVVTNVQPDSSEVTLRVDDSNNTRIRVARSSIREVVSGTKGEAEEDKGTK